MSHKFLTNQGKTLLKNNQRNQIPRGQTELLKAQTDHATDWQKQIFWQTTINDKRPKLRLQLDGIEIKGLVNTGVDITIILSQDS